MIIACLGDSLTYGYGIPRPKVWTTLLARRTGIDVRNCGINGDTTGGMLARFHHHVVQAGADAVLIMGGFNDLALGTGLGTVKANIFALVQTFQLYFDLLCRLQPTTILLLCFCICCCVCF